MWKCQNRANAIMRYLSRPRASLAQYRALSPRLSTPTLAISTMTPAIVPSCDVKKIAINKISDIDRRHGELWRLKSELAALAHAFDGDEWPNWLITEGLAGTQHGG